MFCQKAEFGFHPILKNRTESQNVHIQLPHYKILYHAQWFYAQTEEIQRVLLPVSVSDPLPVSLLQVPGGSCRVLNRVVLKDLQRKK